MAGKNKEFTYRLKKAIADTKLSNREFAAKEKLGYSTLMNYLNRNNIGKVPEWDQLVKISKTANKSIDWFLTGEEKINEACEVKCGKHIAELCKKVKDVVESGTHWGASLEANIHSFKAGLDGDKEREEIKKDMNELKKSNAVLSSEFPQKNIGKKKKM